ncbi:hypothetical protein M427DRAFT_27465 [Gonapodya prolifera JEL478]|uniref:Uncharacterized protein n=1 Tax=Gonapodya prolifera (strain JEL478) TaxID=1344416 RepID=A0A139AZM7_GONPJ|nr:hypothetical protein M427DRAFT_27465 [Gonapodya prolifera JEL478]|eukprot:KXS21935.1 hypothetical protein M427DRAFT_27465 [Gonapodya prolifera JEL478]
MAQHITSPSSDTSLALTLAPAPRTAPTPRAGGGASAGAPRTPAAALRTLLTSLDSPQAAIAAAPRIARLVSSVARTELSNPASPADEAGPSAVVLRSALKFPPGVAAALDGAREWWNESPNSPAVQLGAMRFGEDQPRPEWKEVPADWSKLVDEKMGDGLGVFFEIPGDVEGFGPREVEEGDNVEVAEVGGYVICEEAGEEAGGVEGRDGEKGEGEEDTKKEGQVEQASSAETPPEQDSSTSTPAAPAPGPTPTDTPSATDASDAPKPKDKTGAGLDPTLVYIPGWGYVPLREARPVPATAVRFGVPTEDVSTTSTAGASARGPTGLDPRIVRRRDNNRERVARAEAQAEEDVDMLKGLKARAKVEEKEKRKVVAEGGIGGGKGAGEVFGGLFKVRIGSKGTFRAKVGESVAAAAEGGGRVHGGGEARKWWKVGKK